MKQAARRSLSGAARCSALFVLPFLVWPSGAWAQTRPSSGPRPAIGEQYRFEIGATFWKPDPTGIVSGGVVDGVNSDVDLVSDLGYAPSRFREWKFVLRPGRKHKIRVQYTPIEYSTQAILTRDITFSGQTFTVSLPIDSTFKWTVWRFGYEYDFFYTPRGFLGVLAEGQWTDARAELTSAVVSGEASGQAILPAVWLVARAYPLPDLALNLEVGGMRIPKIDERYESKYVDWDVSATVNITNSLGVQGGWRRMTHYIAIDEYAGDFKFQGYWWGFAIRY